MKRLIGKKLPEAADWESFVTEVKKDTLVSRLRKNGLDEAKIEDVVAEFLQAGIVSSAASLGFLLHNLAVNLDVQEKLLKELRAAKSGNQVWK